MIQFPLKETNWRWPQIHFWSPQVFSEIAAKRKWKNINSLGHNVSSKSARMPSSLIICLIIRASRTVCLQMDVNKVPKGMLYLFLQWEEEISQHNHKHILQDFCSFLNNVCPNLRPIFSVCPWGYIRVPHWQRQGVMREEWYGQQGWRQDIFNGWQWRQLQRVQFGGKETEQTKGSVKNRTAPLCWTMPPYGPTYKCQPQ